VSTLCAVPSAAARRWPVGAAARGDAGACVVPVSEYPLEYSLPEYPLKSPYGTRRVPLEYCCIAHGAPSRAAPRAPGVPEAPTLLQRADSVATGRFVEARGCNELQRDTQRPERSRPCRSTTLWRRRRGRGTATRSTCDTWRRRGRGSAARSTCDTWCRRGRGPAARSLPESNRPPTSAPELTASTCLPASTWPLRDSKPSHLSSRSSGAVRTAPLCSGPNSGKP
jgi:hypothetical protein